MHTCHRAAPGPVPRVLGALLLLATTLGAQNEDWDRPVCTKGEVFVASGQRAVMTCNISNPFTHITIRLSAPGVDKTIFSVDPPGNFSLGGWQLQVQGGQAQLVIDSAQDSHAGLYFWLLYGYQVNPSSVFLNVSASPEIRSRPKARDLPPTPEIQALRSTQASGSPRSRGGILAAIIILMLVVTVLSLISWYRPCRFGRFQQMPLEP